MAHGAKSRRALALSFGLSLSAVNRHAKHRLADAGTAAAGMAKARQRGGDSAEQATHKRIDAMLAGSALVQEVQRLKQRADALGAQAEASGDARTALLAIRELTRLIELQGRMTLEASAGRASDIANHPIWHEVASGLMGELMHYPEACQAVHAWLCRRLGVQALPALVAKAEPTEGG